MVGKGGLSGGGSGMWRPFFCLRGVQQTEKGELEWKGALSIKDS